MRISPDLDTDVLGYSVYKSKYIILVAAIAPHKLKKLAVATTAVVVPDIRTIVPMQMERKNCARNTMLLTTAISVPKPRALELKLGVPVPSSSN